MFNFYLTYRWLQWGPPKRPMHALPGGIGRFFVDTPSGKIEVLYGNPKGSATTRGNKSPLFFVHGGMGGAWVWLEYLQYFSARGIPCYAVSMRGHGDSWCPSFLRLTYGTTKRMLASDVVAGIRWAQAREGGKEVVLAAHSSGGGLSQFILSEKDVKVKGLVLVAAVPGFGSVGVYMNWFALDPVFTARMLFHGWHPNSPLSHPALTRQTFFSKELSEAYVEEFQSRVSPYESFLWIMGMGRPFVKPQTLLQQITSWGTGQKLLVLCGGVDKLMTKPVMEKLATYYRLAFSTLVSQKKLEVEDSDVENMPGEGGQDTAGHGVRLVFVPGAGHHLQNDVTWEVGAGKLLAFYQQL
ncbi:Alpha/Beta hydrolase protein [Lasiosphaeria hispida]|uniref:Alpha/Beta hydrolase protein n=1 Tax=Lasiosphaeria hispida TaxID=260671 RepID=A0AAJ0M9J0_9PEZI|nr:Alpha/Beta hydrolase protein [Lasiosphaeria hispida]